MTRHASVAAQQVQQTQHAQTHRTENKRIGVSKLGYNTMSDNLTGQIIMKKKKSLLFLCEAIISMSPVVTPFFLTGYNSWVHF